MAADERLSAVVEFVTAHLEAEAALTIATLGEPDDDAYLAAHDAARAFYAPGTATPLGPLEGRRAVPGGVSPRATRDVRASVTTGTVFVVGELRDGSCVAFVSSRRDLAATAIAEALVIRRIHGELRIVGRAAVDPFTPGVVFEAAGGDPVDLSARPARTERLAAPGRPEHAAFLDSWARP